MFPELAPAEIERVRRFGEPRSYNPGEALEKVGAVVHVSTPAEFEKHIANEVDKWKAVREKAGIPQQ